VARTQARVHVSLWQDADFVALSISAQRLYLALLSQPTITLLGVLALTPSRWGRLASDGTLESVLGDLRELESHRFIVVDEETEELLVRSFLRYDGGWQSARTREAAVKQRTLVASKRLLAAIDEEIARLRRGGRPPDETKDQANTPSDGVGDTASSEVAEAVPDTHRACAHAVSCLQSPVSGLLSPPDEVNLSTQLTRGAQSKIDGPRPIADVLKAHRDLVRAEFDRFESER